MEEQSDQNIEVSSSPEAKEEVNDAPAGKGRLRRMFGFLGSWSFWGRLAVGVVLLGAGVLIGLGVPDSMDDDQRFDDHKLRENAFNAFRMDPLGKEYREGGFSRDGKRFRFYLIPEEGFERKEEFDREGYPERGARLFRKDGFKWDRDDRKGEGFEEKFGPEALPREEGFYLPYEAVQALIERLINEIDFEQLMDRIDRVIAEVERYGGEGEFGPRMDRPFGPGWFFDRDAERDFDDEYPDDEKVEDGEESSFEGFEFPFGEFLSGFEFLEDCELDPLKLPSILEKLPEPNLDDFEEGEDFEELFRMMDELFREVCETPPDG